MRRAWLAALPALACTDHVRVFGGGAVEVVVTGDVEWEATVPGIALPDGYQGFALAESPGAHGFLDRRGGSRHLGVIAGDALSEGARLPQGCEGDAPAFFAFAMRINGDDVVRRHEAAGTDFDLMSVEVSVEEALDGPPTLRGGVDPADLTVVMDSRSAGSLEVGAVEWRCAEEVVGSSEMTVTWDFAASAAVPQVAE